MPPDSLPEPVKRAPRLRKKFASNEERAEAIVTAMVAGPKAAAEIFGISVETARKLRTRMPSDPGDALETAEHIYARSADIREGCRAVARKAIGRLVESDLIDDCESALEVSQILHNMSRSIEALTPKQNNSKVAAVAPTVVIQNPETSGSYEYGSVEVRSEPA